MSLTTLRLKVSRDHDMILRDTYKPFNDKLQCATIFLNYALSHLCDDDRILKDMFRQSTDNSCVMYLPKNTVSNINLHEHIKISRLVASQSKRYNKKRDEFIKA